MVTETMPRLSKAKKDETVQALFRGSFDTLSPVAQMEAINNAMTEYWKEEMSKDPGLKTWLSARNKKFPSAGISRTYEYFSFPHIGKVNNDDDEEPAIDTLDSQPEADARKKNDDDGMLV